MRKKYDAFENCVFVNCPFDKKYAEFLYAIIFTIICCKKIPRLTLLEKDSSVTRLDKIKKLISSSMFGIHDLSRCKSSKVDTYFRMNMPFELGLDMGAQHFAENHATKKIIILVNKKYDYQKAISDLSGNDPICYNGKAEELSKEIRDWLVENSNKNNFPSALQIWNVYGDFLGWLKTEKNYFETKPENVGEFINLIFDYFTK